MKRQFQQSGSRSTVPIPQAVALIFTLILVTLLTRQSARDRSAWQEPPRSIYAPGEMPDTSARLDGLTQFLPQLGYPNSPPNAVLTTHMSPAPPPLQDMGVQAVYNGANDDTYPLITHFDSQMGPVIAYSDPDAEFAYLLVWVDDRTDDDGPGLYFHRLNGQGEPAGGTDIGFGPGRNLAIAANNTYHEYLVIWENEGNIYGQRVTYTGSISKSTFPICASNHEQKYPAIAYGPTSDRYLVVWSEVSRTGGSPSYNDIYGAILRPRSAQNPIVERCFPISEAPKRQLEPDIAYNIQEDNFFVVWQDIRSEESSDLYGQLVSSAGDLLASGDLTVTVALGNQTEPDIAYNADDNQYLVVWQDDRHCLPNTDWDIYGQQVAADGALLDNPNTSPGDERGAQVNFAISTAEGKQESPSVACADGEYLVVWADGRPDEATGYDIYGQHVSGSGALEDFPYTSQCETDPGINFPLSQSPANQIAPYIAAKSSGQDYDRYLVVWQDDRDESDTETDIYGWPYWHPRFGAFSPTGWITEPTRTVVASVVVSDAVVGLDISRAAYRFCSLGTACLPTQSWQSATATGEYGTKAPETVRATVTCPCDSKIDHVIQFAITNTIGHMAVSPIYTLAVDATPPAPWTSFSHSPLYISTTPPLFRITYTVQIADATSGLDCNTASYRYWPENGGWSDWQSAQCPASSPTTTPQLITATNVTFTLTSGVSENSVQFHIRDEADNLATSPIYAVPIHHVYLPFVLKNYPPYCCDVPYNGDFSAELLPHWQSEFDTYTAVKRDSERASIGGGPESPFDLPSESHCAYSRLYQQFDLPGEFGPLWLKFEADIRSSEDQRTAEPWKGGDSFRVYAIDVDDGMKTHRLTTTTVVSSSKLLRPSILLPTSLSQGLTDHGKKYGTVKLYFEVEQCERELGRTKAYYPTWVYLDNVIITNRQPQASGERSIGVPLTFMQRTTPSTNASRTHE